MLYELLWTNDLPPGSLLELLRFVSFRAVAATVTAFVLALVTGRWFLRFVKSRQIGERIAKSDSEDVRTLHAGKEGTPTMGGVFLIGSLLASSLLWIRWDGDNRFSIAGLLCILGFAAVGLADDVVKFRVPGAKGLSQGAKHGSLTLLAVAVWAWLVFGAGLEEETGGPFLRAPFLAEPIAPVGLWYALPFLMIVLLVMTGTAHAVNLTDGLDGLATGCMVCSSLAYAGICYFVGHAQFADYLQVGHVPGSSEMTVLLGSVIGASLGFLWFNAAPAQVFMGDVGSLGLGASLGYVALVSRTELMLVLVGGVFVSEAVSVILQVIWVRRLGRKLFRVAPWHHHFQSLGVPETRIVLRFWIVAALCALSSLALLKVNLP
jgi:phospho-N-acetylmuramoyl-pentapeptide-transferase